MSSRTLYRLSGLALLLGSLIMIISTPFTGSTGIDQYSNPLVLPARLGQIVAGALLLAGLVGLYLRQAESAGKLGLLSFCMAFLGNAAHWNLLPVLAFAEAFLAEHPQTRSFVAAGTGVDWGPLLMGFYGVSALAFYLGMVLLGVASLRAHVFPRPAAAMLIIGPIIAITVLPSGLANQSPVIAILIAAVFVSGFAWCGYALWAGMKEPATRMTQ